jgi:hypothetical protein
VTVPFALGPVLEQILSDSAGRMVVVQQHPVMIAVVNEGGRAALFVRVSLEPTQAIGDGRGFTVRTTRNGNNDYVQISSADKGAPPLFIKLAEYVCERVSRAQTEGDAAVVLTQAIEEFRRFAGQRRGRLSESVVRGTFAELLFLQALIASGMDTLQAVTSWRGPWAKAGLGVHDFTFADGRGVEVKATRQPPNVVRVSSATQLVPSNEALDLIVLPLEDAGPDASTAVSFRTLAASIETMIRLTSTPAAEVWEAAIDALMLDLSDEWYDRYRFIPGKWLRFSVQEEFPHLDLASVPAGLIDIRYSLELLKLANFSAPFEELFMETRPS